jgi:hypothetical protein
VAGDIEGDEQLRERLREATSGDAAVRQLRRRYDALRQDYEQLLDRLTELEDRLDPAPTSATATPASVAGPGDPFEALNRALAAPLLDLRDSYLVIANRVQSIAGGLERLAAGALKAQHGPAQRPAPAQPADPEPGSAAAPAARPQRINLDVQGSGFGDLLDFQERLSAVFGVARVTITAIEADRATLSVELVSGSRD